MTKSLRILNVDDNEVARYVKSRMLRGAGHKVSEAETAAEALRAIAKDPPDLLLLDVQLPDMSGFEVASRVRADPKSRQLPIVQVSAICVTRDDEVDGLESGADVFLSPPFDAQALVEAVERAIRLRESPAASGGALRKLGARDVGRVQALVKSRMAEALSVADLAAATNLSVFHFSRLFKAATGETPHAFLVRARIVEGMRLLRETQLGLGEVAERVGFRTHAHFSRAFRANTGTAPRDYRARFEIAA